MFLRCKFHECLLTSPGVGPRSDSDEEAVAAVTFLETWLEQGQASLAFPWFEEQEVLHKSDEEEAMISTLEGSVGLVFFTSGSVFFPESGSFMRERLAVTFLETRESVDFSSRLGGFTGSENVKRVSYVTKCSEMLSNSKHKTRYSFRHIPNELHVGLVVSHPVSF